MERWHRQLRASLKCQLRDDWVEILLTVLLGLRTRYKEDLKCSVAELLYGTTLRLPGEFFIESPTPTNQPKFVQQLKNNMQKLRRVTRNRSQFKRKNIHSISTCTHVFLRSDAVWKPLQHPYTGPHEIVSRTSEKVYAVKINGRT